MNEEVRVDQSREEPGMRLLPALAMQGQQALLFAPAQGELYLPRCPAWVYVRSLAKGDSQRTIKSALRTLVQIIFPDLELEEDTIWRFPWGQLRYEHTSILRSELQDRYDFTTANKHLSALRQVLKHAWLLKLMDVEDYMRAISIKDIRGTKEPSGRLVTGEEFARMVQTCLDDLRPQGIRDQALLVVLYVTGLRRSELSKLNLEDYTPSNHALRIRGKGNKGRTVYVNADGAAAALDMWLEMRGRETGPLFCPIDRWGHVRRVGEKVRRKNQVDLRPLARLTPEGVYDVFMDRSRQILTEQEKEEGKEPARTHDIRRTMISTYFDSGVDVAIMRRLTGHVKMDTLVGYDRRPARAAEQAARVIVLPGSLRKPVEEQEGNA